MQNRKNKRIISFRKGLLISFAIFSLIVLAIVWTLQIFLLPDMYKAVRKGEIDQCLKALSTCEEEKMESVASEKGEYYDICITIYKRDGDYFNVLVESHNNPNCFIHHIIGSEFAEMMYKKALENKGVYSESSSLGPKDNKKEDGASLLSSLIIERDDGNSFFIIVNAELVPLSSTVSTIVVLLTITSGAVVATAVILSLFLSKKMSKAAVNMSNEANKLALGNYDVNFDGGSYKEMVLLADALNNAASELSQLDRMQKDLIANVSHDLRTPLTLIEGYSEVMRDIPDEMTSDNIQIIIDETRRLSSLVNDLLDLSKLNSQKQTVEKQSFSLSQMIDEIVSRYSKLCEQENVTIEYIRDENVNVFADRIKIQQVIYNLVNNAINYAGDDRKVIIRQTKTDEIVKIEVEDHGCGISEEDLPFIWERYYKSKEFHKRASVGTGLGLSIVKNILLLHEARFGVTSKPGEGSVFWFELPAE